MREQEPRTSRSVFCNRRSPSEVFRQRTRKGGPCWIPKEALMFAFTHMLRAAAPSAAVAAALMVAPVASAAGAASMHGGGFGGGGFHGGGLHAGGSSLRGSGFRGPV